MDAPLERRLPWVMLLGRVGAAVRGRIVCTGEEVSLECDLRFRYRGLNPMVVALGGVIAGGGLLLLLVILRFR